MNWPRRIARRLRALFQREAVDRELDEEMRLHLALESLACRGKKPGAAHWWHSAA